VRRMLNRDVAMGFQAWLERYEAKTYALERLRKCYALLHSPGLVRGFEAWIVLADEQRALKARLESRRDRARLEFDLSQSKNECSELKMVVTARNDEIQALKDKLFRALDSQSAAAKEVQDLAPMCERQAVQLEDLHRQLDAARMAHDVAEKANDEARLQMIAQNESNQQLLEKLLAEQRATFGEDTASLNDKIQKSAEERRAEQQSFKERTTALTQQFESERQLEREAVAKAKELEAQAVEAEMRAVKERLESQVEQQKEEYEEKLLAARAAEKESEEERARVESELNVAQEGRDALEADLKALTIKCREAESTASKNDEARLKVKDQLIAAQEEIARLKAPKPKETPKRGESPLKKAMNAIAEANPGMLIPEQLGLALKKNAARVIDLFRQWDTDGDGEVSRAEFHKAMPALGVDLDKKDIDALFDAWDAGGGGSLDFKELSAVLKGGGGKKPTGSPSPAGARK